MWLQVLSALPEPLCPGVYSHFHNEVVLASAAYYAVELPPALLCTWVRCNSPRINLTGAKLTVQVRMHAFTRTVPHALPPFASVTQFQVFKCAKCAFKGFGAHVNVWNGPVTSVSGFVFW